jgi:hypothetical protein
VDAGKPGVVKDEANGLEWQRWALGWYTQPEAADYCLSIGMRLPAAEEVAEMFLDARKRTVMPCVWTSGSVYTAQNFWTSTEGPSYNKYRIGSMDGSYIFQGTPQDATVKWHALCVK